MMHFFIWQKGNKKVYLCISTCGTTSSKRTRDWNKVTCEHCLQRKEKYIASTERKSLIV